MRGPAQTSEPVIQYLYQLIDAIAEGKLLIPRFQRPLVWKWERQSELLLSVRDGIPMGAVMIWRTSKERIKWQGELAGHRLPSPAPGAPREYLLDGLQRLSTLFAALRGFGSVGPEEDEDVGAIGYNLEERSFVVREPDEKPKPEVVPLKVLPDSITLLRFQRGLKGQRAEVWIERSDTLAKAFREYKVPVIPIVSDDFEVAARTFNLINSQGVRMGEADMIHALTWSPKFELRDKIESLRSELLQPIGWGEIDFETILKVVKAEADLDLYEESVEQVSKVLKKDPESLDRAFECLAKTANLLREECGVRNWELVPYALQAVLLADAFRLGDDEELSSLLSDWFWLTTYGEMFAGLSGYRLGLAVQNLRASCKDGELRWSGAAQFRVRPLPATADFRAVRMKALALQLARSQRDADPSGLDPFKLLADNKRDAMFPLLSRRLLQKSNYSSPANRFLCAPEDSLHLRQRILDGNIDKDLQVAHVIPSAAVEAANEQRWDDFIGERLKAMTKTESSFIGALLKRNPKVSQ